MPALYNLACDSCDVGQRHTPSVTMVRLADGTFEICGHPLERRAAERLTGEPWAQLITDGRIVYRYTAVCGHCGKADLHKAAGENGEHAKSITRAPSIADLAAEACANCGERALVPLADKDAIREILCPHCAHGHLESNVCGFS
jgi:hypothetical protein